MNTLPLTGIQVDTSVPSTPVHYTDTLALIRDSFEKIDGALILNVKDKIIVKGACAIVHRSGVSFETKKGEISQTSDGDVTVDTSRIDPRHISEFKERLAKSDVPFLQIVSASIEDTTATNASSFSPRENGGKKPSKSAKVAKKPPVDDLQSSDDETVSSVEDDGEVDEKTTKPKKKIDEAKPKKTSKHVSREDDEDDGDNGVEEEDDVEDETIVSKEGMGNISDKKASKVLEKVQAKLPKVVKSMLKSENKTTLSIKKGVVYHIGTANSDGLDAEIESQLLGGKWSVVESEKYPCLLAYSNQTNVDVDKLHCALIATSENMVMYPRSKDEIIEYSAEDDALPTVLFVQRNASKKIVAFLMYREG